MSPILIITIILGMSIIGLGLYFMASQQKARKQALYGLIQGKGADTKGGKETLAQQQDKRRAEIAKKLKVNEEEEGIGKKKKRVPIKSLLEQAGLSISVAQFFTFSAVSAVLFAGFAVLVLKKPLLIVLFTIIGFFGFPRFVLKKLRQHRQKKFLQEFPDALEASVRLLKAGMPIAESISMIAREFSGPVGEEMTRIYEKQKIGIPMYEAAYEASERMPLPEMKMFATGLAIQAQTGSSMSEILLNLSNVIRQRFKLKRKIKALSSEAIASAGIIGSLPILLSLGMYFANREYIMILFDDSFGQVLLGAAVTWMCLGIFVMKQMINFKI